MEEIQELTTKYIYHGGSVQSVLDLGINEQSKNEFVNVSDVFTVKNPNIFETKKDAMYYKLIIELSNGHKLENYKRSKYYKYYLKRLKNEHPEYLI